MGLNSAVGKAVANHTEVRGSIPSTDVGKEPDREIFSPVSDASVQRRTAPCKDFTSMIFRWNFHMVV